MLGSSFGQYRVTGHLGKGGMGDVYRARDPRLDRDVALKILPPEFTADADRVARFEREARLLASLNHPHIAAIYGLESADGRQCLVLEYVEGENLAERLSRGPIPLDEALAIGVQVADALEAAHERGVIHRDLKPGNVMVDTRGSVKLLDFGLAKAVNAAAPDANDMINSPTMSIRATQAGVILGTAPYMSPEQARGRPIDTRTDIWAFGCLLYEMLTGAAPFAGSDVTEVVSAIIQLEPDFTRLPPDAAPELRRLIERCLHKNPRSRWRHIGDARLLLEEIAQRPRAGAPSIVSERTWRRILPWAVAAALAVALAVAIAASARDAAAPVPLRRFAIDLPPASVPNWTDFRVVVSPHGSRIAYNCRTGNIVQICVRSLDSLEARPVAEGRDLDEWFFSDDGEWIGLSDGVTLAKVSVRGGEPQVIHRWSTTEPPPRGFSWGADGRILFGTAAGLRRIPASGGAIETVTRVAEGSGVSGHESPSSLPGGRQALITIVHDDGRGTGGLVDLGDGAVRDLGVDGFGFTHVPGGWIAFARGSSILAARFEPATDARVDNAVPVIENAYELPQVAQDGTLAYVRARGDGSARLVWVDREGRATAVAGERHEYSHLDLAPDGRRALLNHESGALYVLDLDRGTRRRLAEGAFPIWAPDGARVAFSSKGSIRSQAADGSAAPEVLVAAAATPVATSWHPKTGDLAYYDHRAYEIWVRSPDGNARRFLGGPGKKRSGRFSPDGKWMAFVSDETGEYQVYVTAYPGAGQTVAVSLSGGLSPIWSADGSEVFFRLGSKVMAARISSAQPLRFDVPIELFDGPYTLDLMGHQREDVAPDGRKFLMVENSGNFQMVVVQNWPTELSRLVR